MVYSKRCFLIAILFLHLPLLLFAQTSFQKVIESGATLLRNPKITEDGKHLYMQGISANTGLRRAYLTQFDEKGNVTWAKSFGNAALASNVLDILPTDDGCLIPLVEIEPVTEKGIFYLVKLDLWGNEVWNVSVGESNVSSAPLLTIDDKKNIWISYNVANTTSFTESYIAKISPNGKMQFLKRFVHNTSFGIIEIKWSEKTNTLIGIGLLGTGFSPSSMLFSLNPLGQIQWAIQGVNFKFSQLNLMDNKIILLSRRTSLQLIDILTTHDIFSGKLLNTNKLEDVKTFTGNQKKILIQYGNTEAVATYDQNFSPQWAYNYATCTAQPYVELGINSNNDFLIWKEINNKILLTKPAQNGLLKSCGQQLIATQKITPIPDKIFKDAAVFTIVDLPLPAFNPPISIKNITTFSTSDFCPNLPKATFSIPDSVCHSVVFLPKNTNIFNYKETWYYDQNKISTLSTPDFKIPFAGKSEIKHVVENGTCSDTVRHTIEVLDAPNISFRDTTICGEKNALISFVTKGGVRYSLDGVPLLYPYYFIEKSGEYKLRVSNGFCESEKKIKINFAQKPVIQFVIDSIYCKNTAFQATINNFDKVFWDEKPNTSVSITDDKKHFYKAILGVCTSEGVLQIPRKTCDAKLYLPNIFSPNDDDANDFFSPLGVQIELLNMTIFNRWGGIVFQTSPSEMAWNGKEKGQPASEGVYLYTFIYKDLRSQEIKNACGEVLLVR